MKKSDFDDTCCRVFFFWAVIFFLQTALWTFSAPAGDRKDTAAPKGSNTDETIRITSEKLISNSEARWAEFIGNVKAVQGNNIITADSLKIFYTGSMKKGQNATPGGESIKEIVATGNVKIHFDNRVAVTQRAVYTTEDRVLVLSGSSSKISSGKDSIAGEKITLFRAEDRIVVEGGSEKQVEAVLYSGEKGIK